MTLPTASSVPSELSAVMGTTPEASALLICCTSSSGAVKTTEIGCSCTIDTMPVVSVAWTRFAGIDKAEAGFFRERRIGLSVAQLRLGVVDGGLVAYDLRYELIDVRLLCIELLCRGGEIFLRESSIGAVDRVAHS